MRTNLAVTAVCWFCLGCGSKPNQVHFIIPNDFRGAFAVQPDDLAKGKILVKEDGRYLVRIPESGVLGIKGYDPFRSYLCTASFTNGDEIWVSKRFGDKPRKKQVALWGGSTQGWHENGKPVNVFWWFVGTEDEWNASGDETRHRVGRVSKKSE